MGDGIADQAHAPQDQKHAQGRRAARQEQSTEQCATHEDEFVEGLPEMRSRDHQATCD
ncbi:UNVERIFIED_ORG: hypothetical protein OKW16_004337 [Pseudomonas reinekei]|nr:hypothetical protein [Pseudomonas reinekei]